MGEEQKKQLEQQLWNIANALRGKMDADEFRDYILGFIFYKYLSEKMEDYANKILAEDEITYLELQNSDEAEEFFEAIKEESIEKLGYFLKPNELFGQVAKRGGGESNNFILEDLTQILRNIEQTTMGHESEDDFVHLFEDLDLTSTKLGKSEEAKNSLIVKVLTHLDTINFELKNHDRDVLGDAYEYLIGQFAAGAGKKAGEFYTPQQVSKILAKIVTTGRSRLKSVYDPTCGSGSLLLRVAKEVEVSSFYGQEMNRTTYNLARMNMIMHDVHYRAFDIKQEDTLEYPQHIEERFEAIVANPPFSAKWSANKLHLSDDRFSQYGKLAPSSKADFAFVQHMIHHLDDHGTMAVVLPHGVLFRGAAEGHIRKYLIEDRNYLDAVIGLPANIFYGTSIPTCILVFKKCREDSDCVLFIDASNHFEKVKNQNLLRAEDIEKIVTTYREREAEEKYAHLATLDELKENDYNLNIPRYVDTFEEEEPVDLEAVSEYLSEMDKLSKENDKVLFAYCEELNLPKPMGNNISLLQAYKKGVMQKIFSQEIRFRDDNGGEFGDWVERRLKELLDYEQPTKYIVENTEYSNEYKTPVLTAGKTFILGYIDEKEGIYTKKPVIIFDDFTTSNHYVDFDFKIKSSAMKLLTSKGKHINLKFLYESMQMLHFPIGEHKRYWISEYSYLKTKLPCIEEQTKIANFLSSIDQKIEQVTQQVEESKKFKKGLLQQMFV